MNLKQNPDATVKSASELVRLVERKITRLVIDQLMTAKKATPKQQLISDCHDPLAIVRTVRLGLITESGNLKYVPTILGFELCADPDLLSRVRTATETLFRVLRNLAERDQVDMPLGAPALAEMAEKMFSKSIVYDDFTTAIFTASEFPIFGTHNRNLDSPQVSVGNDIFTHLKEIDHAWDRHVASRIESLEGARSPRRRRAFLSNLYELAGGKQVDISQRRWFQAAHGAGFQPDEIEQLIDDCEADGTLYRNVKTGAVSFTDAAFTDERDRAEKIMTIVPGSVVFISCGQFSDEEKALGKQIASMVKLLGFQPFFAEEVHDLDGLDHSILRKLSECAAFITVLHPRGEIITPNGEKVTRASVWIEQEIAIAAYIQRVEKRKLPVIAFAHEDVSREGLRTLLHLNPIPFRTESDVILKLPEQLGAFCDVRAGAAKESEQSPADWLEQY